MSSTVCFIEFFFPRSLSFSCNEKKKKIPTARRVNKDDFQSVTRARPLELFLLFSSLSNHVNVNLKKSNLSFHFFNSNKMTKTVSKKKKEKKRI